MQWFEAALIDQIVAGTKTATVRFVEWSEGLDDFNTALHVGAVYDVFDRAQQRRCAIRLTGIELVRWDAIPERLWRRDPAVSGAVGLEAFRADHVDYFNDPADEFEFLGIYFERHDG